MLMDAGLTDDLSQSKTLRSHDQPGTCPSTDARKHNLICVCVARYREDLGFELLLAPSPAALACIETNRATSTAKYS